MNWDTVATVIPIVVAILALFLSWSADRRAKDAARSRLFLDLRAQLVQVHEGLPSTYRDPTWTPTEIDEKHAVRRYWYHAFNEWFITNRLNRRHMKELWDQYYADAVLAGLEHRGLREFFKEMTEPEAERPGQYWRDFREELERLWRQRHPTSEF